MNGVQILPGRCGPGRRRSPRRRTTAGWTTAGWTTAGWTTAGFERQRRAISEAVTRGEVDEETARELIGDIDLRQTAGQAPPGRG